jgi:hypothetical protein
MTPKTLTLYAFGESATSELDKIQNIFKKSSTSGGNGGSFLQPPPVGA